MNFTRATNGLNGRLRVQSMVTFWRIWGCRSWKQYKRLTTMDVHIMSILNNNCCGQNMLRDKSFEGSTACITLIPSMMWSKEDLFTVNRLSRQLRKINERDFGFELGSTSISHKIKLWKFSYVQKTRDSFLHEYNNGMSIMRKVVTKKRWYVLCGAQSMTQNIGKNLQSEKQKLENNPNEHYGAHPGFCREMADY